MKAILLAILIALVVGIWMTINFLFSYWED